MFATNIKYRRKRFGSDLIKKAIYIALKISEDIGCRCVFVDSLVKLETINFYNNMGFKFVDKPLGTLITKRLINNEKIENKTIKMYFDLFRLKR